MNSPPRVRFCWDCGRQLYGNHHTEKEIDGHLRILHKDCCEKLFPEKQKSKRRKT